MRPIVPDASVLIKWSLPEGAEEDQNTAKELLEELAYERIRVMVPALWYFEVGNTLARKYPDQADASLQHLQSILQDCVAEASQECRRRTIDLVRRHRVTFYDASYHALAIIHDGVFVTADEKYLQAVAGEPNLMHLKDWR
jgi:predicted nucleic acid-binding protein